MLSSPAVELLRVALPESHLTMMVGPWSEEVAQRDPMLDAVLSCPFPGFTRVAKGSALTPYQLLWAVSGIIRGGEYDAAVVLRHDHWWGAWAAALAEIPVRVGFGVAECRPFLSHSAILPEGQHWTARALTLASTAARVFGGVGTVAPPRLPLRFGVRDEDEEEAARLWDDLSLGDGPVVVLHPGAGATLKLWPEGRWVELGRRLAAGGSRVLLTGSTAESPMAERIAGSVPGAKSLAGLVGLGSLAALFRRCSLVAGTDNGPLHMAAAMDTPSVRLYGPTDPAVYGPWGEPDRHLAITPETGRSACGRLDLAPSDGVSPACMRAISIDQVESACLKLLARKAEAS